MLSTIRMPQMGVSDESAILSKWLVREGDRVRKGQPVFSLETDKATFQYEAESDGFLVRILTGEGGEATVGSPVGILSDSGVFDESELDVLLREQNTPDERPLSQTESKMFDPHDTETESETKDIPVQNNPAGEKFGADEKRKVSPRARKKANELNVDVYSIGSGSGPDGRILERDVLNAIRTEHATNDSGVWPGRTLTVDDRIRMRPVCAEAAGQTGFVGRLVDARRILSVCTPRNKLTPGTVVCHELVRLLARMPELNARRHGDRIYEYGTVHLRLTVETPSGTLKPVVRCAEAYTMNELAILIRNASNRCKRSASKPQEFQEGTFAVADLSRYGADWFTPEITPPELCTLGIGAAPMQTRRDERGGTEAYPAIRLTLAYDRAGVDALRAAKFLNELAIRLEPGGKQQ